MHPVAYYEIARSKIDDEHRAADRRRLAKLAAGAPKSRSAGPGIVERVWNLFSASHVRTADAEPAR